MSCCWWTTAPPTAAAGCATSWRKRTGASGSSTRKTRAWAAPGTWAFRPPWEIGSCWWTATTGLSPRPWKRPWRPACGRKLTWWCSATVRWTRQATLSRPSWKRRPRTGPSPWNSSQTCCSPLLPPASACTAGSCWRARESFSRPGCGMRTCAPRPSCWPSPSKWCFWTL